MIRAICGVARSFKIYYPIRGHEVGPITSNILFPECDLKRTRGGNVLFKRRELRGEETQEIRVASPRKREGFQFRFTRKSTLYRNLPPHGSSFNGVH